MATTSTNANDGAQAADADGGEPAATVLDPAATVDELDTETMYLGQVTRTKEYGVFVALTPQETTDVTGLAHKTNLPPMTKPRDFSPGSRVVIGVDAVTADGPALVLAYGEDHNPEDLPFPDEYPAMSANPDPTKHGTDSAAPTLCERLERDAGLSPTDAAGEAAAGGSGTTDEFQAVVDELWKVRQELEALKADTPDTDADVSVDAGAAPTFADSPLQDVAMDLLRLAESGVVADTVSKEQLKSGTTRYTVTVSDEGGGHQ